MPPDGGEITAALALPKGLPLAGTVVTGDAAICPTIRDRGGDDMFAVEADQPDLMADIAAAFGDAFPPGAHPCARACPDAA